LCKSISQLLQCMHVFKSNQAVPNHNGHEGKFWRKKNCDNEVGGPPIDLADFWIRVIWRVLAATKCFWCLHYDIIGSHRLCKIVLQPCQPLHFETYDSCPRRQYRTMLNHRFIMNSCYVSETKIPVIWRTMCMSMKSHLKSSWKMLPFAGQKIKKKISAEK
jgi:hypothetical protein